MKRTSSGLLREPGSLNKSPGNGNSPLRVQKLGWVEVSPKARRKKLQPSKATVDEFIKSLELFDVRLVEGNCKQNVKEGPLPTNSNLNVEITTAKSASAGLVRVIFQFTMTVSYDDTPDEAVVLIAARFQMMFKSSNIKAVTKGVLIPFGQSVALFAVWPYWREFVNNSNSRMGLPAFAVPLLKANYLNPEGDGKSQGRSPKGSQKETKR